ncbi:MAG: DNA primase [Acidimicrobiaceae bacterium]|nr:DNA primase [Acidimicrobiaceae bacterium]
MTGSLERIERLILSHLIHNENFSRKVVPYVKAEYFEDTSERMVFKLIQEYILKHNDLPTKQSLSIDLDQLDGVHESDYTKSSEIIHSLNKPESTDITPWLVEQSETFCQDKAIYNAVVNAIAILEGNEKTHLSKGAIPTVLSDALAVSFDPHVGHDFIEDAENRFEFYHRVEEKLEYDLEMFNKITKGGLPKKTLNICLAGTGVGKSLFMCHQAAAALSVNKNVLYITLEMAEERIAERIDANLLDIPMSQLEEIPRDMYKKKIDKLKGKTKGKVIIKEYPTASASAMHFKNLLGELNLKRNFVPDIIFIDYLNICTSSRIKAGANVNSYTYIKSIAEELRGLAVEYDVPIVSATQTTRTGFTSTDIGLEDTSESFGLPATADFMFALISSEEMEELNQLLVKQLKNRYNDPTSYRKFIIGVDRSKMRLYDVEQKAQEDISDSGQDDEPLFDTSTGNRMRNKADFGGFQYE